MSSALDVVDPIDETDVAWVSALMDLRDLDASRRRFLLSMKSMDVSACPGSGKTTLVVAKLAILAKKWRSRTRGICVLSHTNVARKEIEERLADTEIGHILLGYPHYIDTIHGFANRFLAAPWLLSHGHSITTVDNDITAARRCRLMGKGHFTVQSVLEKKKRSASGLRLQSADFSDPLGDAYFPTGRHTNSYKIAATALTAAAEQGFFCHEEMLLFAEALLQERPEMGTILSQRFPFVLLDEMQDTSKQQCEILQAALPLPRILCMQRVGDPNQAIFDDDQQTASESRFPDPARSFLTLPSSFRFDSSIAAHADRLAVQPVEPGGLQGLRTPSTTESPDRHVVFVFPDGDTSQVIPAFAEHVAGVMEVAQITKFGPVVAVGEVHKQKDDVQPGHKQFPGTVCNYWDGYRPSVGAKTARPTEFVDYIRCARALMSDGHSAEGVDLVASGIARLANMLSDELPMRLGSRPHRALERRLETSAESRAAYRDLLLDSAPGGEDSYSQWSKQVAVVQSIVGALLDMPPATIKSPFLGWKPPASSDESEQAPHTARPNIYGVDVGDRTIDVQMSSIHAVKGETHFATLVLETFNYTHALRSLLPWLTGERCGIVTAKGVKEPGVRDVRRLRKNYVALTRATHVVCLAMPASAVEDLLVRPQLEDAGWRIVDLEGSRATGGDEFAAKPDVRSA